MRSGGLDLRHHVIALGEPGLACRYWVNGEERDAPGTRTDLDAALETRALSPGDLWLLNSTSGTTGMPKCVQHDQQRWSAFHGFAVEAGELSSDDVFLSAVPAPYGFGLWTAHVTPTLLGAPVVVLPRFSPEALIAAVEEHRVTVMAAVSTQFILMLESPALPSADLSSLRVLFTGGEAVPYERAAEFERRTGARVLQFYGSNETGAVSRTTLRDSRTRRLRTSGRVIPEMNVRLFDAEGADVTESGRGQPGCKGPTLSRGYWEDEAANAALWRDDGWMMLGDVVEIDDAGYLTVIGRTDDFIIRGGKNVSAVAVEEAVASHPAVTLAAAVAMPDSVFGEKVCAFVELRPGGWLDLQHLRAHLVAHDVSKEVWPERLEIMEALPRGPGGKVAKRQLRDEIARKLEAEQIRA
jgi:acyl-CoA synthetase